MRCSPLSILSSQLNDTEVSESVAVLADLVDVDVGAQRVIVIVIYLILKKQFTNQFRPQIAKASRGGRSYGMTAVSVHCNYNVKLMVKNKMAITSNKR